MVQRKYSDFLWLRETLQNAYPGIYVRSWSANCQIPKLLKKPLTNFQDLHIQQRMNFFEKFLNSLLQETIIACDLYMQAFLQTVD